EAADALRLPSGALAAPADDEPDRVDLRDGEAASAGDQGRRLAERRAGDGLQAAAGGGAELAEAERGLAPAPGARRREVREREARGTSAETHGRRETHQEDKPNRGTTKVRRLNSVNPQLLTISPRHQIGTGSAWNERRDPRPS